MKVSVYQCFFDKKDMYPKPYQYHYMCANMEDRNREPPQEISDGGFYEKVSTLSATSGLSYDKYSKNGFAVRNNEVKDSYHRKSVVGENEAVDNSALVWIGQVDGVTFGEEKDTNVYQDIAKYADKANLIRSTETAIHIKSKNYGK